jgi:hypothetical protein
LFATGLGLFRVALVFFEVCYEFGLPRRHDLRKAPVVGQAARTHNHEPNREAAIPRPPGVGTERLNGRNC